LKWALTTGAKTAASAATGKPASKLFKAHPFKHVNDAWILASAPHAVAQSFLSAWPIVGAAVGSLYSCRPIGDDMSDGARDDR